jgi:hypothetical protein
MTAVWASIAATAGAVATTLVGVVAGAAVSKKSQHQGWARDQLAQACVRLLDESSRVLADLNEMERTRPRSVPQGVAVPTTIDWRPWNQALNMINLTAGTDIVDAAHHLDEQVWRAHLAIRRGQRSNEDMMALREPIYEAQRAFINTARQHLTHAMTPLRRLNGKPASGDPIWTELGFGSATVHRRSPSPPA